MTTFTIHMDDDAGTIREIKGPGLNNAVAFYDGRGGYMTLFLNERSIELLERILVDCKRHDITEMELPRVAQDSRR